MTDETRKDTDMTDTSAIPSDGNGALPDAKSTDEETYVSDEMRQILDDIAAQDALIEEAREVRRKLVRAKRRQARLDAEEAERRAREREQRDALELWRMLHKCDVRWGDGNISDAYEFVADKVLTHLVERSPADESEDTVCAHADERTDTSEHVGDGAETESPGEAL